MGSRMSTDYAALDGVPFFWMQEQTGELAGAVRRYLEGVESPADFTLVLDYVRYWVNAPCWRGPTVPTLRARLWTVSTRAELRRWLEDALDVGIDPF